jgi:hypothetical protein
MADIKVRFDEMLARRKGAPPLPTAIVHPCSVDALVGAVEAAQAGLIEPVLVGSEEQIRDTAAKAKLDLSPYKIVSTADPEESVALVLKEPERSGQQATSSRCFASCVGWAWKTRLSGWKVRGALNASSPATPYWGRRPIPTEAPWTDDLELTSLRAALLFVPSPV